MYEIYINGEPHTFTATDDVEDIGIGVINFIARKNKILKITGYVPPVNEKIMSRSSKSLELEYSGNMNFSDSVNIYKKDEGISVSKISNVLVGAQNINVYIDGEGHIKTIIVDGDMDLNNIRVGIKNQGFRSFDHEALEFVSASGLEIKGKKDGVNIAIPAGEKVQLNPAGSGIEVKYNDEIHIFNNRVYIEPVNAMIKILSLERGYGTPQYRGSFEVTNVSSNLRLTNEVNLEHYLYQVVPSEMPLSFGLEALKAQAVAARTYAISDLLSGRYFEMGFHVDDSTMSQVYNSSKEYPLINEAIDSTKGLVMKYDGMLIDAKYHSTSHGYGANAHEVWSSNGNFPGDVKPYLSPVSYLLEGPEFDLSTEEDADKFFKDWSLKSYDSDSPYFRWKVTFTKYQLKNTIEKNLPEVFASQPNYILTLEGNEFKDKEIPSNCLGDLLDLKVTKRGGGGNIMELCLYGTNGTYKIIKELNVRYVLRPRKSDTLGEQDILINRIKGADLKNSSLLPSAFMVFETHKNSAGDIIDVTFYGGGYGHGTGMSQYGAAYLAKEGLTFDEILKTYYKDIIIESIS
ncbi:SpoIID/LytB domain-containing protein [Oxobacter pfennigii]|nr:SpoIID/LytB domain-containing protein [Oxobacter pfennigii]